MAKTLHDWIATDVGPARDRPLRWLSERHFFRDPIRPIYMDASLFFAPADGVILYQQIVDPTEPLVEIKGRSYTLRQAMRDNDFNQKCLVIGIFMTAYDVHINRIPYAGRLSYRELPAIDTCNRPMLEVEESLMRGHLQSVSDADYLFTNQRMLNCVRVASLGLSYYLLQIADYDVATILPFNLGQAQPVYQNERFSQIRFGSQVDLIIPVVPGLNLELLQSDALHVEAGVDPLVRIVP